MYSFLAVNFLYLLTKDSNYRLCGDLTPQECELNEVDNDYVCKVFVGSSCNSQSGFCFEDAQDACTACSENRAIGYLVGVCPDQEIHNCEADDLKATSADGPACSVKENKVMRQMDLSPFGDEYDACEVGKADFYLNGDYDDCQGVDFDNICTSDQRYDQTCAHEGEEEVCGYHYDDNCKGNLCRKTYKNACYACSDPDVYFHLRNSCESKLERERDSVSTISSELIETTPDGMFVTHKWVEVDRKDTYVDENGISNFNSGTHDNALEAVMKNIKAQRTGKYFVDGVVVDVSTTEL